MGASARIQTSYSSKMLDGSPGGDGGSIRIGFADADGICDDSVRCICESAFPCPSGGIPDGNTGVIRFRGVSLITGGVTGIVTAEFPIAFEWRRPVEQFPRYLLFTGGAGGKGRTGSLLTAFQSTSVPYEGQMWIAKIGADGGKGGDAGAIYIEPKATLYPTPKKTCTKRRTVRAHDGGVPKDEPLTEVGRVETFCGKVGTKEFDLVSLFLRIDENGDECSVRALPDVCAAASLLGGSGGFAGGSLSNNRGPNAGTSEGADDFEKLGTAGLFGAVGDGGVLSMPWAMWQAFPDAP
jgi:hypothetical protein